MKNILYTIILCFLFSSSTVHAICGDDLENKINDSGGWTWNTPEKRKKLANLLLDHIKEIDKGIPRLSPKEEEWLEGELNSGDGRRKMEAYDSKEYNIQKFLNIIIILEKDLVLVRDLTKIPDSKYEIFSWIDIAQTFLLGNLPSYMRILHSFGLLSDGSSEWGMNASICRNMGAAILREIIEPLAIKNIFPQGY